MPLRDRQPRPEAFETAADTRVVQRVADANRDAADEGLVDVFAGLNLGSSQLAQSRYDGFALVIFQAQGAADLRPGDPALPPQKILESVDHGVDGSWSSATNHEQHELHRLTRDIRPRNGSQDSFLGRVWDRRVIRDGTQLRLAEQVTQQPKLTLPSVEGALLLGHLEGGLRVAPGGRGSSRHRPA